MSGGANPNAWNNWYHAVGSTYGTWLRGEPRGFRTHRHRFHVDGDYRDPPPPGVYAPMFAYSKKRMKYSPVKLSVEQRDVLCEAIVQRLVDQDCEVVALAVAVNHFHLLARYAALDASERRRCARSILDDGRDPAPRYRLGLARKHGSFELRDRGLKGEGPVWASRPKFDPVRDRGHQVNVTGYIVGHVREGAAVFDVRRGFLGAR